MIRNQVIGLLQKLNAKHLEDVMKECEKLMPYQEDLAGMQALWESKTPLRPCMIEPLTFVENQSAKLAETESTVVNLSRNMKHFFDVYVKDEKRFTSMADQSGQLIKKIENKLRDIKYPKVADKLIAHTSQLKQFFKEQKWNLTENFKMNWFIDKYGRHCYGT